MKVSSLGRNTDNFLAISVIILTVIWVTWLAVTDESYPVQDQIDVMSDLGWDCTTGIIDRNVTIVCSRILPIEELP